MNTSTPADADADPGTGSAASADRRARRHRRVQREGAPGADPTPRVADRDREAAWSPNDDQLRRDVPPHW